MNRHFSKTQVNYTFIALLSCIGLLFFIFTQLPHTIWHPGIIFAWFMSKGLIFYKDFANMHFPLSTFLLLPFYLISNWNLELESLFSLIVALLTIILIFKISMTLLSPNGTIIALVFFSLLFYYFSTSIQYSMEAVVGLLLTIIIYRIILDINSKSLNFSGIFFDGLLIGLTELTGQIATISLGIIFLFFVYLIFKKTFNKLPRAKSPRYSRPTGSTSLFSLLRFIRGLKGHGIREVENKRGAIKLFSFLVLGILIPIIILSLYFVTNNAFVDFFYLNIPYYFTYLQLAKENAQSSALPWNQITLFYSPLAIVLFISFTGYNLKEKNNIFIILSLITFSSIPSIVFSIFHPHHFLYILPIVAILTGLIFDILIKKKIPLGKHLTLLLALFLIYQVFTQVWPWYWERIIRDKKYSIANDVIPGSDMENAINWVKLNTKQDDRILVAGDNLFYFKADRLPSASRQLVAPWHYKPLEKTVPIIINNRPDYWIIDTDYMKRLKSPQDWNSPEITDFLDNELRRCYQKLATFSTWQVWKITCK